MGENYRARTVRDLAANPYMFIFSFWRFKPSLMALYELFDKMKVLKLMGLKELATLLLLRDLNCAVLLLNYDRVFFSFQLWTFHKVSFDHLPLSLLVVRRARVAIHNDLNRRFAAKFIFYYVLSGDKLLSLQRHLELLHFGPEVFLLLIRVDALENLLRRKILRASVG
jgi:hypothetical protein